MSEAMEVKMTLKDCLKQMVDALRVLNDAKEDCKIICDSSWESLENDDQTIVNAGFKQKQLEKIAKAIAKGKKIDFEDEYTKTGILLERAFGFKKEEENEDA